MAQLDRPLWADLTMESSREEVLTAVAQAEQRQREADEHMRTVEFPEVPDDFEGCLWSKCGTVVAMYRHREEDPSIAAQNRAGEEDQSQPGWDGA